MRDRLSEDFIGNRIFDEINIGETAGLSHRVIQREIDLFTAVTGDENPKGSVSPEAGRADVLVVADLEAGNMLAKQLSFLAGAEAAGVVLGARVPMILTSRADNAAAHLASCALGMLMVRAGLGA